MKLPTTRASSSPPIAPATMPLTPIDGALAQDARQQMPRRRADRQPHAELARARAHREREHAGHADDGDEQRDAGESAEHQRVHAVRRQHFRADVVERRRPLHRLIARQLANHLRHGGTSVYGSTFAWMKRRPPLISCSIG